MKTILAIIFTFVAAITSASTNEHIAFIYQIDDQQKSYDTAKLKEWSMGEGDPVIPESADIKNLEHVKLLVAANPNKYEAYAAYGMHFYLKKEFDVAAVAYEKAIEICLAEGTKDKLDCKNELSVSLLMLYQQNRSTNKPLALNYFDKLVTYNFDYFAQNPEMIAGITLVANDYCDVGRIEDGKRLIQRVKNIEYPSSEILDKFTGNQIRYNDLMHSIQSLNNHVFSTELAAERPVIYALVIKFSDIELPSSIIIKTKSKDVQLDITPENWTVLPDKKSLRTENPWVEFPSQKFLYRFYKVPRPKNWNEL
jgi:tetratricopeptide (TPR) repeat protein